MKVDADAAGLDERQLGRITEHLERRYLEPGKIAGCQVLVARHGTVGFFENLGSMDRERGRPVAEDTLWRIYSMTKPITGVALMTLYERGMFQLDDPVHRFLPEWRDVKVRERSGDGTDRIVEPRRAPTVRDLLTHTSGIGYGGRRPPTEETRGDGAAVPLAPGRDGSTLAEMASRLAARPLQFHPGEHWLYGLSTDMCGRLVEVMSGTSFDEYLRREIFEPLGMADTGFWVRDEDIDRFAANYGRARDKSLKLIDDPDTSAYRAVPTLWSGGGGLVSTIGDYHRFAQMLVNGGELDGHRILGRKTVELMGLNHLEGGASMADLAIPGGYGEVGFAGMGFGLTMAVNLGPAQTATIGSAGEYMWGGAASTTFWVDPLEQLTVIFMTQLMPSGTFDFRRQLKTLVYPAIVD